MDNKRSEFLNRINSLEYNPMCYSVIIANSKRLKNVREQKIKYTQTVYIRKQTKNNSLYMCRFIEKYINNLFTGGKILC